VRTDWSYSGTGPKEFAYHQRGERGAGELRQHIRHDVGYIHFTSDQHPECHRRIIMRPRNVAASVNHYHKRRTDGERRDDTCRCANSRAANCQDKKEGSDKFGDILVHKLRSYPRQVEKSKTHQQWDFGLICYEEGPIAEGERSST
jgi:hypothetical protein